MTDEVTAALAADRTSHLSTTRYVRELAARGVPVLRIARLANLPASAVEAIIEGRPWRRMAVAAPRVVRDLFGRP